MTDEVRAAILALDGRKSWGEVETAREALVPLGRSIFPEANALYPGLRSYMARTSLVYTAMKFALVEDDAVRLALAALSDRSGRVIHRACMLLAVAGRPDTLDALHPLLSAKDRGVAEDAGAAIAAIRAGNRELFLDRSGSGRVHMQIGGLVEP